MRKGWVITGVVAVVLAGCFFGGKYYVTQKVGEEVVKMVEDPSVQKMIDDAIAKGNVDKQVGELLKEADQKEAVDQTASAGGETTPPVATPTPASTEKQTTSAPAPAPVKTTDSKSSGHQTDESQTTQAKPQPNSNPKAPEIDNRSEAISYAMSKFNAKEISHYMSEYANRAELTRAEKDQIKAEILSRFTASELKALQQAAKK